MGHCSSKHESSQPAGADEAILPECEDDSAYHIAGTFSNWEPRVMRWDGECLSYVLRIGEKQREKFQILYEGRWDRVIYPSIKNANPSKSYVLRGPDSSHKGLKWTIGKTSMRTCGAESRIPIGTEYVVRMYLDRQGRPESLTWDLRLDELNFPRSLSNGNAGLDAQMPSYSIAGTWNAWQPKPMHWDSSTFCYHALVRVGKDRHEHFQLLVDGDWSRTIYPDKNDANPFMQYKIQGPDNHNRGLNWKLGHDSIKPGTKFKVKLFVDRLGKPRHVAWDMFTGSRANAPTVVCLAGLASGSLEAQTEPGEEHEVCWLRIKELIQRPAQTFDKLRLHLVEDTLKDGTVVNSTKSNVGCEVRAYNGLDGIKDLNPTGHLSVPVWASLIDELEGDFSWHAFNYDWRRWGDRKYAEDLVDLFRKIVEEAIVQDAHPSGKASLVAHSMGASVALFVLSMLGDAWVNAHINQLVLVAPAHMGSPSMISSFAHCPFVDTQTWLPVPAAFDSTLGDLTATWACMIAEMPMAVGNELPWPEDYVFATTPHKEYKLKDIGSFLQDLAKCKAHRESGPALWDGVQHLASLMKAPSVPTTIIYSDRLPTPAQLAYDSSDLGQRPRLQSTEPGDGTIVAASVEAVARAWQQKGAEVHLVRDPSLRPSDHKELIACPFTVGVVPKVLKGERLTPITVDVISAEGLKNADSGLAGVSDPYCRFEILGKPSSRRQTPVVDNDLNPVWNYTNIIYAYDRGDDLTFVVYDRDPCCVDGDFLGSAVVTSSQIEEGFDGTLELAGAQGFLTVKVALLNCNVEDAGPARSECGARVGTLGGA